MARESRQRGRGRASKGVSRSTAGGRAWESKGEDGALCTMQAILMGLVKTVSILSSLPAASCAWASAGWVGLWCRGTKGGWDMAGGVEEGSVVLLALPKG